MALTRRMGNAGSMMLAVALMAGCAMVGGSARPQPVKVPDIVALSKSGMPAADIIGKMRASGTVYRLQASQLAELKAQGVAPEVVDYMQQTYLDAVSRDASYQEWSRWSRHDEYWYGGAPYDWSYDRAYRMRDRESGEKGEGHRR
jgi:hypothetical protein